MRVGGTLYASQSLSSGMTAAAAGPAGGAEKMAAPHTTPAAAAGDAGVRGRRSAHAPLCPVHAGSCSPRPLTLRWGRAQLRRPQAPAWRSSRAALTTRSIASASFPLKITNSFLPGLMEGFLVCFYPALHEARGARAGVDGSGCGVPHQEAVLIPAIHVQVV